MLSVRVRFAPSPSGYVHVGNARTALFNWLFARHHAGAFVRRIEDTDVERSEERYEAQLMEDLRWLGLDWDEGPDKGGPCGPYRQSERKDLYAKHARQLIDQGHAYFCFCSQEQLEVERQEALKAGLQPRYSGRCRARPREEAARKVAAGEPAAVRLQIAGPAFTWNDLVHGPVTFASDVIGDFILVRSDGNAAYNYAVVIDDHLMDITHVIRGDDHISNTPRQLAVYQAFGWEPPHFGHLSTILGPDRKPLSKRHGATSLQNFREQGILPEALRNYLLLLGWSAQDGKTEILSTQDMIAQFSLDRINKSSAVFDSDKLDWMNRLYLSKSSAAEVVRYLVTRTVHHFASAGYIAQSDLQRDGISEWLNKIILQTIKARPEAPHILDVGRLIFAYDAEAVVCSEETRHVAEDAGSRQVLMAFIPKALAEGEMTYEKFREIAKSVQKETGRKGKDLFHPIRVALTGAVSGPELEKLIPIFEEGAKLRLAGPVKSCAERLREFAEAAKLLREV
ncbi:MAG: glutamate--tRNA ligase [Acidobacteria bacterium]|nr:MAG: glutamate--tRNA ligase [Acidobacteriota bacterium]